MSERPLNDLDADLRTLLSVEPSPEFIARVRMRVAGERMAPRWAWMPLSLAGMASAAAVVAIAVGWEPAVAPPPGAPAAPVAVVRGTVLPPLPAPGIASLPRGAAARTLRAPRPRPVSPAVDIIVDPRQRAGVNALLALANRGTVLEFAPAPEPAALPDIVVEPLNVPLLTVDPPAKPAGAERSDS